MRFGKRCGSEALYTLGQHLAASYDAGLDYSKIYRTLRSVNTPRPEDCDVVALPCAVLPELGVMVVRESTDPTKGTILAFKGGHNAESHNHNDIGNFIVYRNGKPVLIDVGVGTYTKQTFSADRYKLWFMQSGYHNLPSFNGVDQHQGGSFFSIDDLYSEENRTLSMELSQAYTPDAHLDSYRRTLSLDGDTVKVTDSYTLKECGECVFHFMSATEPKLTSDGVIALAEDMTLSFDPSLKCEIEGFDPVGMNTQSAWGTDTLYRIKLSVTAESGDYTFTVSPAN
jgi:hypothetical protein